uniref:Uncharacterized protein n=1 Tax=Octopus bimaculoides TaxID=37653 RepID=A0A0L8HKD3_OCTBM
MQTKINPPMVSDIQYPVSERCVEAIQTVTDGKTHNNSSLIISYQIVKIKILLFFIFKIY